jgi:hypothetical protein
MPLQFIKTVTNRSSLNEPYFEIIDDNNIIIEKGKLKKATTSRDINMICYIVNHLLPDKRINIAKLINNKKSKLILHINNEKKYLNIEYKYSIQDGSNNKNIPIKVSCIETNNELIMDIEYKKLIG